jgi:hypothetical protein
MEKYRTTPLENLIADALIRTSSGDPDDVMRAAAAAIGFERSVQYMSNAGSLIDQVENEAEDIAWSVKPLRAFWGS